VDVVTTADESAARVAHRLLHEPVILTKGLMPKSKQSNHGRSDNDSTKDKFKGSPEPDASQAIESGEPTLTGSSAIEDKPDDNSRAPHK
jgi:hypothetical protein